MENKSILIVGGGFAGMSAGIYALMNGYSVKIFEMHDQPGGLCTSWKRKGYTIDGCIHWLVGSSPTSSMYRNWQETGVIQGREIINLDEYARFEASDGRTLIFYNDIDKLEKHLLEFSPQDEKPIREFTNGIRMCLAFDMPSPSSSLLKRIAAGVTLFSTFVFKGSRMKQWMKTTAVDFASRIKDKSLREAFMELWVPEFSMLFMLFTFAWLHRKNAGYPVGGSLPMSEAMEKRYKSLGGEIEYNRKVEKIITEGNRAIGIRVAGGAEFFADRIISAADGYSTIVKMLDGKYTDEKISGMYKSWPVFPPLLYIGLGVKRSFSDFPRTVSGMSFPLQEPVEVGGDVITRLPVHIYNQDPTLAPEGKTTVVIMLGSSYDYWKGFTGDRKTYLAKKEEAAKKVIGLLEQRFPGISADIEMTDVATPLTFERYTGNWQGSFEGWLITPENSDVFMKPLSQKLPGLEKFYMCGQWVEPGGGLPTSVMSARRLIKAICKEDGNKFKTVTEI